MANLNEENKDVEFQGDMPAAEASGKCVETLIKEGITYTGHFRNGLKNGPGLLVSESLDSLDCEFLDD